MVAVGDIIQAMSPQAGYRKWHLCVLQPADDTAGCFLFLNSNAGSNGFVGDFVCPDTDFPFLPKSPTRLTVISCSAVVRFNQRQLEIYDARVVGVMPLAVAIRLRIFAASAKTFTARDKAMVLAGLDAIIHPTTSP